MLNHTTSRKTPAVSLSVGVRMNPKSIFSERKASTCSEVDISQGEFYGPLAFSQANEDSRHQLNGAKTETDAQTTNFSTSRPSRCASKSFAVADKGTRASEKFSANCGRKIISPRSRSSLNPDHSLLHPMRL